MKNTAKSAFAVLMVALTLTSAPHNAAADGLKDISGSDPGHKDWPLVSVPSGRAPISITDVASIIVSVLVSLL
jgi:hypothetical protein